MSKKDIRKEFLRKRRALLFQQDELVAENCNSCPKFGGNTTNSICRGCDIFNQFNAIGESLEKLSKAKREQTGTTHLQFQNVGNYEVVNIPEKPKGAENVSTLTLERYQELKEKRFTDSKIMKEFGMNNQVFYDWKREQGLVRSKSNDEQKPVEKAAPSQEIEQISIDVTELENERDRLLEESQKLAYQNEELTKRLEESNQTILYWKGQVEQVNKELERVNQLKNLTSILMTEWLTTNAPS